MKTTVAEALRRKGYVLEACSGNKTITFELWASLRDRGAAVVWTTHGRKAQTSLAHWVRSGAGDSGIILSSSVPDGAVMTTGWMACLLDLGRAFELAFPCDGACYPDVLTRAWARAMGNYDVKPMGGAE